MTRFTGWRRDRGSGDIYTVLALIALLALLIGVGYVGYRSYQLFDTPLPVPEGSAAVVDDAAPVRLV